MVTYFFFGIWVFEIYLFVLDFFSGVQVFEPKLFENSALEWNRNQGQLRRHYERAELDQTRISCNWQESWSLDYRKGSLITFFSSTCQWGFHVSSGFLSFNFIQFTNLVSDAKFFETFCYNLEHLNMKSETSMEDPVLYRMIKVGTWNWEWTKKHFRYILGVLTGVHFY